MKCVKPSLSKRFMYFRVHILLTTHTTFTAFTDSRSVRYKLDLRTKIQQVEPITKRVQRVIEILRRRNSQTADEQDRFQDHV